MQRMSAVLATSFSLVCAAIFAAGAQAATAASTAPDACALLSDAEIQSVQGEKPGARTPTDTDAQGLSHAQCYFALPTAAKSISLTLTRRSAKAPARDPRTAWRAMFEPKRDRDAREHGGEEEESKARPQKLDGLGDAAYWLAGPFGGSLYVLKRHAYLRISVGGTANQAEAMKKSQALVQLALKRL